MSANSFDIPSAAKKDETRKRDAHIVLEYRRLVNGGLPTGAAIDRISRQHARSFHTVYRILVKACILKKNL